MILLANVALINVQIELEFRSVGFCGGRKTGEPGEKPSEQSENQSGIEQGYRGERLSTPPPVLLKRSFRGQLGVVDANCDWLKLTMAHC